MQILDMSLINYRNIEKASVKFSDGINILFGENANGKTNAIEAIYQFAQGKSFRTKNALDLISFDKNFCDITIDFTVGGCSVGGGDIINGTQTSQERRHRMNIKLDRDKIKKYTHNGVTYQKVSEFIGYFKSVLFTPDHLSLIKSLPENRRKFLDIAISQLKPMYVSYLVDYMRILTQRNHLLKKLKLRGGRVLSSDEAELEIWTEKMAKYSAMITRYRGEYIERLKELSPGFYNGLSGGRESISLSYISQINKYIKDFAEFKNYEQCEKLYGEIYAKGQREEINYGTTLYGPHRDDLYVAVDGKSSRNIASQGQQRSAVLALKLAEGEISKIVNGEYPVFLLDDILSELDRSRQEFIFRNLENRQVIVTCCNRELFENMNVSNVIEVVDGEFTVV